jgi:Protein of unknown function (DUF3618)
LSGVRELKVSVNNPQERQRTASQIEADLAASRDRMSESVEALIDQVHPNRVKQRLIGGAKQLASAELEDARSKLFNARGDLRRDRLVAIGGAVAGFVAFVLIIRALVRRGRS